MTDPLAVLPLAVAAGGGTVDDIAAARLIAAGIALLQRSAPLVRALRGRRAAILLPTSAPFLTALAACEGRGAVLVNPLAAPPEIAFQLDDADVGAVFTIAPLAPRLPGGRTVVLLDAAPESARLLAPDGSETVLPLASPVPLDLVGSTEAPGLDEEAAVVYTSALAGRPWGAILTHANLLSNARATVDMAGLRPDEHSLAILPFAHLFGLVVSAVAPLLAGGRVTTMPRFNPMRAADLLLDGGVTFLAGVPSVFGAVLAALERRGVRGSVGALRLCICGGAPLDAALQDRWASVTGVELRQGYGLTEAGPVCLFNRVGAPNARGMLGTPFPDVEVAVRDGELWVRGPNVSPGYVGAPHAADGDPWSAGLPRRDGWLRTGDRGHRRDDGAYVFDGLAKPMFTRNGFNIYPREIERVVDTMPGASRAHVAGIPEATKEHDIALDVTLADGATDADVAAWCVERLAAYKQPTIVRSTPA